MNPVLIILLFIGGFLLWLLLAALYKPLGKLSFNIFIDAKDAMFDKKDEEENE